MRKILLFPFALLVFCNNVVAQTITTEAITGSPFCPGSTINVPFSITGTFNAGNIFTAELSDAAGSFAIPVNIGTLSSTSAGTVAASLSFTQIDGTLYRIRVTASDPVVIGSDNGADLIILAPSFTGTKDWVGTTGDWNNPSKWSPCGVPSATDNVIIAAGDDVTIPAGVAAVARRIYLSGGGDLTIASTALLTINNSTQDGIQVTGAGTSVSNAGTVNIGNTGSVVRYGIYILNTASFTNAIGAVVSINRITTSDAVFMQASGSLFTNNGLLKIGDLAAITRYGFNIRSGSDVINNSTGNIEINFVSSYGIYTRDAGSSFSNTGNIKMGNSAAIGIAGITVDFDASFTNNNGATIEIDNIAAFGSGGIQLFGSAFNNSGLVKIGNTTAVYRTGIELLSGAVFTNTSTGQVEISRTNNPSTNGALLIDGISTQFSNAGSLKIGVVASPTVYHGIKMSGSAIFDNLVGATLQIDNLNSSAGIAINYTSSTFNNAGNLLIGTTGGAVYRGLDRFLAFGSISNAGTIAFGNIVNYGIGGNTNIQNNSGGIMQTTVGGKLRIDGIITNNNGAAVINNANGLIYILNSLVNNTGGTITNNATATITIDYSSNITNSGTLTNNGLITTTGPQGSTISTIINNNLLTNHGTISMLHANARINNNTGATFDNNGIIKGVGTMNQSATFNNNAGAKTAPGLSPGILNVTGDYDFGSGTFDIEANATTAGNFDVLNVSGTATLTNAVIKLTTGFSPTIGNSIVVLNATTLNGTFATVDAPGWFVNYNSPSAGKITLSFGGLLPLSLLQFTGTLQNNNALLQWLTANETGVRQFEVQRSNDGQIFTTIGTVAAGGSLYSFTDANTFSSRTVAFYRLKSIDVDGKFTYSNIIKLSKQASAAFTVYPNPVSDVLTISGLKQNGTIRLFSAEGKLLQQQIINVQSVTMNMNGYTKGVYVVQYQQASEVVTQKIIKQ
jgi:hypothetical protein